MTTKDDTLDALFRSGFRKEEDQVRQMTEEEFRAFFRQERDAAVTVRPLWRSLSFRVAASFLLCVGGGMLSYRYLSENDPVNGKLSWKKGIDRNAGASVLIPASNAPAESTVSLQDERKMPGNELAEQKTNYKGSGLSNSEVDPAIIDPDAAYSFQVFAVSASVKTEEIQDSNNPDAASPDFHTIPITEQNPEFAAMDPLEIDSIEFRPGRNSMETSLPSHERKTGAMPAIDSLRPASVRSIRNVDQAKVFLLQSLARWAGLIRPEKTSIELNEM